MTTLVTNTGSSGGGGGRSKHMKDNKKPQHANKSSSNVPSNVTNPIESSSSTNNNNQIGSEEFRNKNDKFQPTAEQMRIASLMSDKKDDDLKPKIEQIVELTGAKREDAAVALYDCDNDMTKAIEMILDGESLDSEWQSTGKKKKTKAASNQSDVLTNGKSSDKPNRSSKNSSNNLSTQSKGSRGGMAGGKNNRKKDYRPGANNDGTKQNDTEETDVFTANPDKKTGSGPNTGGKRGGSRGRAPRGKGISRGSRTFMNRGMQNNGNNSNDGFPNSIETWTNNAVEASKPTNDDLNTMHVGNWADVANVEEWSEEDWNAPVETKVFTPSTKVIPEKDEIKEQNSKSSNHMGSGGEKNTQPTISSIISNNIKKSPPHSAGQAFIQQIQQQSQNVPQNSNLNQYNMTQFNSKHATESIKNLVGLSKNNMISNDHSLDNLSKTSQPTNQNRIKSQTMASKIPESAVEMPSNDGISNLAIHFGTIDLGSSNFPLSSNDTSLFDSVGQSIAKKPDNKNLSLLSSNTNATETNYRTTDTSGKNLLPVQGLPNALNDSILTNDHRSDKPSLTSTSYNTSKPLERKNDYISISQSQYSKPNYPQTAENVYSSAYQQQQSNQQQQQQQQSTNVNYYSGQTHQVPFGTNQMLPNNTYNAYSSNVQKNIRDMDQVQTQVNSSTVASKSSYDTTSNTGTSLSLMSSSTSTTNAIKNTLTSTGKGIHSVPPGVNNSVQQVLSAPYIPMGNLPMYYSYEMPFSNTARDHTFQTYATADVKYNRNSESDILPVSSQAAPQTSNQAPNHYFSHGATAYSYFFPNYMSNHLYQTPAPALYTVQQAQNTASATNAFPKPNTAANYGSHSYSFDPMNTAAVQQTQDYVNTKTYQQHKQITAQNTGTDITSNPQNMYSKVQPSISKNYEKPGFQGQTPQMTQHQATAAQSAQAANLAYSNTYMLPQHAPPMQHTFNANADAQVSGTSNTGAPVMGNQRTLSQAHKNIASANNSGYNNGKFW